MPPTPAAGSQPAKATRIALIHATLLAIAPVQAAFAKHWPEAQCMNLLDDSLSADHARAGGVLSTAMTQRFVDLALYTQRTGCSGILFTCSAFGQSIEAAGAAVGMPTLKPNEAMLEEALALTAFDGVTAKIGLIATFEASIPSMSAELHTLAKARGRTIDLRTAFVPQAMQDLAEGRAHMHHAKVAEVASHALADCSIVMLAQFSMAAAMPAVQARVVGKVLSSPDCAVLTLRSRYIQPASTT